MPCGGQFCPNLENGVEWKMSQHREKNYFPYSRTHSESWKQNCLILYPTEYAQHWIPVI